MRKQEYFCSDIEHHNRRNAGSLPKELCRQERDWTCSIACLRSITSSIKDIGSEDDLVNRLKLNPGPNYSKDIKSWRLLDDMDIIYGCDSDNVSLVEDLTTYMLDGYYIMVECMVNYDHWLVLLNYIVISDNPEEDIVTLYDPYYNEVRQMRADEFNGMWCSGEHETNKIHHDFVAIRKK